MLHVDIHIVNCGYACQGFSTHFAFEVIVSKLQADNFIMQGFQELVELDQGHAGLAIFPKEV